MAIKNLLVRGGADFSGMKKEMSKAQKTLSDFQKCTGKIMKGIGVILGGISIGKLIKDSTAMAMGVESAVGNINRNMGSNAKAFQTWVNTQAKGYGIAKADAYKYGSTFSNLLASFTKDTGETASQTQELMKAAAIIASRTGRSYKDTAERIRSGMLGSTEAIEDLGVYTNISMIESTKAFEKFANGKSWSQLDFQTQQQIRLAAILEQTYSRYGDTLADTTQTRQARFIASLKNIQLSLGQAFLPIYNFILPALTVLANTVGKVFGYIAQFTTAIFGKVADTQKQTQATIQQAKATTGLGKASEKAGKQAKKAGKESKNALAGFDEINTLNKGSSSSGVDGDGVEGIDTDGGMSIPPLDTGGFADSTVEVSDKVKSMADKIKTIFGDISTAIKNAWNSEPAQAFVGAVITYGKFLFQYWGTIIGNIAENIIATWKNIAPNISIGIKNMCALWTSFWNDVTSAIKQYGPQINKNIANLLNSIWKDAIDPFIQLVTKVWADFTGILKDIWDKYGKDLLNNIGKFIVGVQETFQLLWDNVLSPIIQPFLEMLSWLWTEHLSGLVQQIGEFIMKCVNGALEIYNGFIKPIIDWMVVEFGPAIANAIAFVVDVFGTLLAGISDVIKGIFKALGGIIDFIVGIFTGNWKKAWQGVQDIFKGIFDALVGIIKVPLNLIIDAINFVIRGLNKLSIKIPDWVPGFGGQTWGISIPAIPKLAKGGITNGPTLAMVGDNPGGKEVISPLDKLQDMIASAVGTAVMSAMQFNSSSNKQGDIIIQLDGTTLARILNPYSEKESARIGNPMIATT